MQEVRNALIAISEGRASSSLPSLQQQETTAAVPRPVSGARRTSFAYTSRAASENTYVSPFHGVLADTPTAVEELSSALLPETSTATHVSPPPAATAASTSLKDRLAAPTPVVVVAAPQPSETRPPQPSAPLVSSPSLSSSTPAPPPPPLPTTVTAAASSMALLQQMDASQRRAATYAIDKPLLLQAGAGSGKTQTMAARIVFLLESGVPARQILGICFTRQAAETLRERVRSTLPPTLAHHAAALKLKTFHAFGLECLRRYGDLAANVEVVDTRKQRLLARVVVKAHAKLEASSEAVESLLAYVDRVKTMKVPPIAQVDPKLQAAYLFPFYQRLLHEEYKSYDFGDLQQMFYFLLKPVSAEPARESEPRDAESSSSTGPQVHDTPSSSQPQPQPQPPRLVPSSVCTALRAQYTHFVVDEFQDFNEIQMELLALLAGDECRVTCVGDPNQCIYTWRGAKADIFIAWKKRFPQTAWQTLEVNYRSDEPIVLAANDVVAATQIAHCHRVDLPVTLVQCVTEDDELAAVLLMLDHVLRSRDPHIRYDDIAILCRTRRRVELYCKLLRDRRIPVRQLKMSKVDRLATMRSLLALLRLCLDQHSADSNGDVRTVLTMLPRHHLPAGSARKFFLALDSVCRSRRDAEAARICAWRHSMDGPADGNERSDETVRDGGELAGPPPAAAAPSDLGVHPAAYSFFAVLKDLVYHNFSTEAFPKLEVAKKSQKIIRHMVQLVLYVGGLLAQPTCDVEDVLRHVLREGGFEKESTTAVTTRTNVSGGRYKRPRSGPSSSVDPDAPEDIGKAAEHPATTSASAHSLRVGEQLMAQCAAEHSTQEAPQQRQRIPSASTDWRRRSAGAAPPATRAGGFTSANDLLEDDLLSPEEEAEVWEEERMNVSELVLRTYRTVQEALQQEVVVHVEAEAARAAAAAAASVNVDERSSTSQSCTKAQLLHGASNAKSNNANNSNRRGATGSLCPPRGQHSHSRDGLDDSVSMMSTGSGTGPTSTLMQSLCPPGLVLRRVLDEFISLVASDNYGFMRPPSEIAAVGSSTGDSTQWVGQVSVGTVHRAKGMEWPAVLIPGCWVGEFPSRERSEEERRVFYVAMSRAMKYLYCFTAREGVYKEDSSPGSSYYASSHSATEQLEPTPYLMRLGKQLECVNYTTLKSDYLREKGYI